MPHSCAEKPPASAGGVVTHRYFIDTDDDRLDEDDEGQELPDAEAARRIALATLPDMAKDKMPGGDHRTFCASVRDEAGEVIYKATLTLDGERRTATEPAQDG